MFKYEVIHSFTTTVFSYRLHYSSIILIGCLFNMIFIDITDYEGITPPPIHAVVIEQEVHPGAKWYESSKLHREDGEVEGFFVGLSLITIVSITTSLLMIQYLNLR